MALTKAHNRMIEGAAVNVKDFGAVGDGINNDGAEILSAFSHVQAMGGGTVYFPSGTYIISSSITVPASVNLEGASREAAIIKQINNSADGLVLSGTQRISNIRIEAPSTSITTSTIGLKTSGCADIIVDNCRILYFGYGVYSTGLTWRQTYNQVRIENPRNMGFYFNEPNIHLEIYLNQCYVVNTDTLGVSNRTSYHIEGSQGTYMVNCTSDGGNTVTEQNLGANIINSRVVMDNSHWEGYKAPSGFISGAEYDGIIRATGSTLIINHARFQNCTPSTASSAALIYIENSSKASITGLEPNTNTLNDYTTQHVGISTDFGDNVCEIFGSHRNLILASSGSGSGKAQFVRKGVIKDMAVSGTMTFNVNNVDTLRGLGTSGTLTGFTGAHTEGQRVKIIWRATGATVQHSASFKLQGSVNFSPNINDVQIFEYQQISGFWLEVFRG